MKMMITKKIFFTIAFACLILTGCKKNEQKETTSSKPAKKENVAITISGMTCEIGCAKTIQSKLSKKEGVLNAKVVFKDSVATIEYDANKTSKQDLISYIDGIAGGKFYKASETKTTQSLKPHSCNASCKETCENHKLTETTCKKDCKMACCSHKTTKEKTCATDCKKACCVAKKS